MVTYSRYSVPSPNCYSFSLEMALMTGLFTKPHNKIEVCVYRAMFEADFESEYEVTGSKRANSDGGSLYLKAIMAEQLDRRRILDLFHEGIVQKLICLRLRMGQLKDPSLLTEINELKGLLDKAIENAHVLTDEIAPHVLFKAGLGAALYDLFKKYADGCGLHYYINIQNANMGLFDETANMMLYNLVKKLVAGVVYHCHADMVGINMQTIDTVAEIVLQDNGLIIGDFQEMLLTGCIGEQAFLLDAAEHVSSMGGKLWVDKSIGLRTIFTTIPLKPARGA
jgi:signal transduction histidine kinase